MEEVVVTGYFTKAKESFTGSEVTIETEELKSWSVKYNASTKCF
ncbi:MAG: hypothetical protein ACLU4J_18105 [Butyricimonas paravirosa]